MHKNRRLISLMCATALLAASATIIPVSAASQQVGTDGIKLYGNTSCEESGHTICVDVWAHGKTMADLRAASNRNQYTDIIAYRDEIHSGEAGCYEIILGLGDRESGIYDAYIACDCGEEIIEDTVIFSNPNENKLAIGFLNGAAKSADAASEVKKICEDYKYALGFVSDYAIDTYGAKLMAEFIGDDGLDIDDKEGAIDLFKKATAIGAIKSGKLKNLFDAAEDLSLDKSKLSTLYTEDFVTADFGKHTTGKLKEMSFNSIEEFDEALCEQFVFSTVKKADGYGNIKKVIGVFKKDIGLNREATNSECLKVMNKEYSSYDDLLSDMLKKASGGGSNGSGGSGGSGGGRSFSGIGDGSYFSGDMVQAESAEKINKNIFDDIDGVPWATEAIVELAQKGIISGKGNSLFCPNDNITREEFVKIIMMTFFADAAPADVAFADVDDSAWYAKYVKMAYGSDVVKGISEDLFGTGRNITREDMAVIAYRTAVKARKLREDAEASDFSFGDDGSISDYAKASVYALYEAEVINGMNASEFAPKQPLTRAQAAKIIYAIYTLK